MTSEKKLLLTELRAIRNNDQYLNESIRKTLIDNFFPSDTKDLVESMSNVTAAFYGLLIKDVADSFGTNHARDMSEKLFRSMGKIKAEQALGKMPALPRNTKAFIIVFIFTVYTSSPGYSFSIEKYSDKHSILRVTGTDRYHKICEALKITHMLNSPPALPFLNGINDALGLGATIDLKFSSCDENSKCLALIDFSII